MSNKKPVDVQGIQRQLDSLDPNGRKKIISRIRKSADSNLAILDSDTFFKDISKPTPSPAAKFMSEVTGKDFKHGTFSTPARIIEYNLKDGVSYRYKNIKTTQQFAESVKQSKNVEGLVKKLREQRIRSVRSRHMLNLKEDSTAAFDTKQEYAPLLGTPFYKQMYLYDYLQMHSKCFYFKNYSGLAKNILGNTRNFVIGRGFSITIDKKNDKAKKAWEEYQERSGIDVEIRNWHDELSAFGELFVKKVFTPNGIVHRSVDPSTIWEIVTDPENIYDVKYYHQQYGTQYQMYGDKNTPLSKYIIQQIPPEQMRQYKVNVTSYEKRGRSDLLSALLYLKYYEDYTQFKLLRVKNEAAFLWDTVIKGDEGDIAAYLAQTESLENVPPGSENVHNEAVTRTPLAPAFSHTGSDDVMKWIVSYICMSVNIPATYLGLLENAGGGTRAGALVATEPVIRMFDERRSKIEKILTDVFDDVMVDAGLDPKTVEREFNFPEFINEDRSKKIQDLVVARDEKVISHKRMAEMTAKELAITQYDYDQEQENITEEQAEHPLNDPLLDDPDLDPNSLGAAKGELTKGKSDDQTKAGRSLDRAAVRKQSKTL